jgi:heme a synthase
VVWLHRYSTLLAAATLLLVAAGGMVTSTSSGLSVPDWPTTYGYNMFSFPLSKMAGGIFYEHGHRLIASTVGFLTIGLLILIWRVDPRRWMRRLGLAALAAVILQGVLGGLTVLYLLPAPISIAHAGLAQFFFCLTLSITLFTSRTWRQPASPPVDDPKLRRRLSILAFAVYCQILLGATMRHLGAGMAIPDFPLAMGHVLPPIWTQPIAVHFAHRVGALIVTGLALVTCGYIWLAHGQRREFVRPSWLLIVLVAAQVTLGGLVVLSGKQPVINTMHVATGALVLGTAVVMTLRSFRVRFAS